MLTDYKFWYIRRDDNGFIEEAAVRFYEGEVTTLPEKDIDGNVVHVTRYRRSKRLTKEDVPHIAEGFKKETSGGDAKIYTQSDFGNIKTDGELRLFLSGEIGGDVMRTVIDEQK